MKNKSQSKYSKSEKGKEAAKRAQAKYDQSDIERRREQKEIICERKGRRILIIVNGNKILDFLPFISYTVSSNEEE